MKKTVGQVFNEIIIERLLSSTFAVLWNFLLFTLLRDFDESFNPLKKKNKRQMFEW